MSSEKRLLPLYSAAAVLMLLSSTAYPQVPPQPAGENPAAPAAAPSPNAPAASANFQPGDRAEQAIRVWQLEQTILMGGTTVLDRTDAVGVRDLANVVVTEVSNLAAQLSGATAAENLEFGNATFDPALQQRYDALRNSSDADFILLTRDLLSELSTAYGNLAGNGADDALAQHARDAQPRVEALLERVNAGTPADTAAENRASPPPAGNDPAARDNAAAPGPGAGNAENPAAPGQIVVEQEAPRVEIAQGEIRVYVTQPPAEVDVQQNPPQIIVRQPPPTITIQMPAPVVTVDMPEPEVIVQLPDPDVAVNTPQPEIRVEQGPPQVVIEQAPPEVRLDTPANPAAEIAAQPAQPQVQFEEAAPAQVRVQRADPDVRFEGNEPPNVVFEGAQQQPDVQINRTGEPRVRIERVGEAVPAAAGETPAANPADAQNPVARMMLERVQDNQRATGEPRDIPAGDLIGWRVLGTDGDEVGTVTDVVRYEGTVYVVVSSGGFLGIGDSEVMIPLDAASVRDDGTLTLPAITAEQATTMVPAEPARFDEMNADTTVTIRGQ